MRKTIFSEYMTALRAEHIKKKGTGMYLLSIALGLLFPAVLCVVGVMRATVIDEPFDFSFYMKFIQDAGGPLLVFFLPLLLIVMTSRIAQLDHSNGGWQLMETQPTRKFALYFAKFSIVLISLSIAILLHLVGGIVFGWVMSKFVDMPDNALMHIPWPEMVQWGSRLLLAGLYIAALQYVLAVLIPSFIWAILIGFGLLLAGAFVKLYGYHFDWYPYHIMSRMHDFKSGSDLGHWFVFTEYVSLCAAIVLLYMGFQWYRHKGWYRAFFAKPARGAALACVMLLGGVAGFSLLRPKTGGTYPTTILAGEIKTAFPLRYAYVINPALEDTIAVIPVSGNRFHHVFEEPPVIDYYHVEFDRYFRTQIFFGGRDSVYIKGEANERASRFSVKGTRLADNRAPKPSGAGSRVAYYLQQNLFLDNPERFGDAMRDDWKRSLRESSQFKTVDNRIPKPDFAEMQLKLMAVNYLNYWTDYIRKREAVLPAEDTVMPTAVSKIQAYISFEDETLLSYPAYRRFVADRHMPKDTTDAPQQEKALRGIASLPNSQFRDKLLYSQLAQALEEASDSLGRTALLGRYRGSFSDSAYRHRIDYVYAKWQRLGKGGAAPLFSAVDISGNAVSLADMKGQPVVIDVWATWCGPCKQQSPHFERLAIKYKDEPVHFVALSVDQDQDKWEIDAKMGSKLVKQWHVNDIDGFGKDYNASTIPRFLLIDAAGKFVSAQMPMPSENTFELILNNTLRAVD